MKSRARRSHQLPHPSEPMDVPGAWATWLVAATIIAAGLVAWWNSFSVPFLFDDAESIVGNPTIRELGRAFDAPPARGTTVSGRPLVNVSFALNYAAHGLDVPGYHVTNLALHLGTGLVLFGLIRRTLLVPALRPRFARHAWWIAGTVALWWTIHPLQTAAVTYLAQRAEVMGALFGLLTLYCFVRGAAVANDSRRSGAPWLVGAVLACALGMASKESVAVTPLLALLYDCTFLAGSWREAWRMRWRTHAALAATWLILALLVWQTGSRGGTVGASASFAWWSYALQQTQAVLHYLGLAFWPRTLVFDHGTPLVHDWRDVWLQSLVMVLLAAVTLVVIVRRPTLGFPLAAFCLLLAPTSSIVPVQTQTVAEHRMYLPLAAVLVLVVVGLHALVRGRRAALFCVAPLVIGIAALGVHATRQRNRDYRSAESIWRDTVRKKPDNARARTALGLALLEDGRPTGAVEQFEEAIALDPLRVPAHGGLGNALLQLRRHDDAVRALQIAAQLQPDSAEIHSNLGNALLAAGRIDDAIREQRAAVRLAPDSPSVRENLALTLSHARRPEEALAELRELRRIAPDHLDGWITLASTLVLAGRPTEAVEEFRAILAAHPERADVWCKLGFLFATVQRTPDAIRCYEEALRHDPGNAEARQALRQLRPTE